MPPLIIHHDDCLKHDPGPRHPESARRLEAVIAGLSGLPELEYLPAPLVTPEQAGRVHGEEHRAWLAAMEPAEGRVELGEADTLMSPGSMTASLRGAGAICFAIDEVMAGNADAAFCAVRPPGHHSGTDFAMGFCLLNHVAIGARHAQALEGVERVAIVDFDVHHGNGTQQVFEQDPSVLFVSSHQLPLYPGTGQMDETGCGNILNLPLPPGAGSLEFRRAWSRLGLPAVHSFAPDLILVSAGFDAHRRDPLAQLELEEEDFLWITSELVGLAQDSTGGRLVSILEGGYDLEALAGAARAHVQALPR